MPSTPATSPPAAPPGGTRGIPVWVVLLLGSLVFLTLFLSLEPLLTFGAWGSDSGEYATLTAYLLAHGGFFLNGYRGWGFGYPYFPGTFEVGAAVASVTGTDPLLALEIAVPALGALGVLPFFLLFRRLYPSDAVAFLAAALTAVASVRLLVLSHAAPQTLGDLLWAAGLWMLVAQRRDPRWMVLLVLTSGALIETHHLSSYFFLVSGIGLVAGLELFSPGRWSARFPAREFLFLGGFTVVLFTYWFGYAPPFGKILTEGLLGGAPWIAPLGGAVLVALAAVGVHLRRRRAAGRVPRPAWWRLKWPSSRRFARDAGVLGALIVGGLAVLFVVPLPGTSDLLPAVDLLWFAPLILYVPFAAGGKGMLPVSRLGPATYTFMLAVGLSAIFALVSMNGEIPLDRHPEFLLPPLALVTAAVLGSVAARVRAERSTRTYAVVVLSIGALIGANALAAYPPPAVLEGFQEGFTVPDVAMTSWMAGELPHGASLASDHRLSDLYFYFSGGAPATWDNATCLFNGDNAYCAYAELQASDLPNPPPYGPPPGPVDAVAVDEVMEVNGVALNPASPAVTLSPAALERLQGPGFVLLYSQGDQQVWWVDLPAVPVP